MNPTAWEQLVYGDTVKILDRKKGYDVYQLQNEGGKVVMSSFSVFEGIRLIFNDVHMQSVSENVKPPREMFEINHCLEGRIECEMKNGKHFYVAKGDLSISTKNGRHEKSFFPVSHYHGVSICIEPEHAQQAVDQFFGKRVVDLQLLCEKFCGEDEFYVVRAREDMQHLFMQLYGVPEQIRQEFFRLKTMEVLLYLWGTTKQPKQEREYYSKAQVEKVKRVEQLISNNLQNTYTLEELSKQCEIPVSTMKKCFKGVFGMTIHAYSREKKMQQAARILGESSLTVLQVANSVGYENGSKFASAFQQLIGVSPKEFRKNRNLIGVK